MKRMLAPIFTLLVGSAIVATGAAHAAEFSSSGGMPTNSEPAFAAVQKRLEDRITALRTSMDTLTTRANTVSGTTWGYDTTINNYKSDLQDVAAFNTTVKNSLNDLSDCVYKGENACLPEIKVTEFTLGRKVDGSKEDYESSSFSGDSVTGMYTYKSDVSIDSYPFCALMGGQELNWKTYRVYRGSSVWEAQVQKHSGTLGEDASFAYIKIRCFDVRKPS